MDLLEDLIRSKMLGSNGKGSGNAVLYTEQSLTTEQQAQARANIGALTSSEIGTVFTLKGSVELVSNLPASGNTLGDAYYVSENSSEYVWMTSTFRPNGYWEELGKRTEHYTATWELEVTGAVFTWTCNRTYDQIYEAYSSGKQVAFAYDGQTVLATFVHEQGAADRFTAQFDATVNGDAYRCTVWIISGTGIASSETLSITPESVAAAIGDMTEAQTAQVLYDIGGTKVFIVTFTYSNTIWNTDKTLQQVYAAFQANYLVLFVYSTAIAIARIEDDGFTTVYRGQTVYNSSGGLAYNVDMQMINGIGNNVIFTVLDGTIKQNVSGSTPTITAAANTVYNCGELTSLTVDSFPESGKFWIWFTSGATPTTTVGIANFVAEANKKYRIFVEDGYAVYDSWSVGGGS